MYDIPIVSPVSSKKAVTPENMCSRFGFDKSVSRNGTAGMPRRFRLEREKCISPHTVSRVPQVGCATGMAFTSDGYISAWMTIGSASCDW